MSWVYLSLFQKFILSVSSASTAQDNNSVTVFRHHFKLQLRSRRRAADRNGAKLGSYVASPPIPDPIHILTHLPLHYLVITTQCAGLTSGSHQMTWPRCSGSVSALFVRILLAAAERRQQTTCPLTLSTLAPTTPTTMGEHTCLCPVVNSFQPLTIIACL